MTVYFAFLFALGSSSSSQSLNRSLNNRFDVGGHPDQIVPPVYDRTSMHAGILRTLGHRKMRNEQGDLLSLSGVLWEPPLSGCSLEGVPASSHIVPWTLAPNAERIRPVQRPTAHTQTWTSSLTRLLVSFNDDGSILLSEDLSAEPRAMPGVSERSKLRFVRPFSRKELIVTNSSHIVSVTFEVDTETKRARFNVPKGITGLLGLKPGNDIAIVINSARSGRPLFAGVKTLKSGREIYGADDVSRHLKPKQRIRVEVARP